MPTRIRDYRPGRATVKGRPVEGRPSLDVTAVWADEATEFFRCRTRQERVEWVRGLDALGLLLRNPESQRLTREVRTGEVHRRGYPVSRRAYVLLCAPDDVPRKRRHAERPRERVLRW